MQQKKTLIFISHAHKDREIVGILKSQIDAIFANGVEVFASSVEGAITFGANWFDTIRDTLEKSQAVIFLVTPASIDRAWIWFEMGATWNNYALNNVKIFPICYGIEMRNLPYPLSTLQAVSLQETTQIRNFFKELIQKIGFGDISRFKTKSFSELKDYPSISENHIKLEQALTLLIKNKAITERELDVFATLDLLPVDVIRKLKQLSLKQN